MHTDHEGIFAVGRAIVLLVVIGCAALTGAAIYGFVVYQLVYRAVRRALRETHGGP